VKIDFQKLAVLSLLVIITVTFTHCGDPFKQSSELVFENNITENGSPTDPPITGGTGSASEIAFRKTVYPITYNYCISCHSTTQPVHASRNITAAHNAVLDQVKVNFSNIPSSRMVAKLRDENHNCWSDCEANADQMQYAIEEWHKARIAAAPNDETPEETALVTSQTQALSLEFMASTNPPKSKTLRLNMASAILGGDMLKVEDKDLGLTYIWRPNDGQNTVFPSNNTTTASANLNFQIKEAGIYKIWGLANAPSANDDAIYFKIPSGAAYKTWTNPVSALTQWNQLPDSYNLSVGNHTLEFRLRKDGLKVYDIILTADPNFDGTEVGDFIGVTLSFDISNLVKLPGAKFQIDVSDYDPYSYKFTNPRVITTSQNIRVKGVKLLINDFYNPQHSTFNFVNVVVSPTSNLLSNSPLVAIKDKGVDVDRISFAFDDLSTTNDPATGTGGDTSGVDSLTAFTSTVYQVSRTRCVLCHDNQPPRHAADNNLTAHDDVLNRNLVDFENPQNSKIVTKVQQKLHNCGNSANCRLIGDEFIEAIKEWKKSR